MAIDAVHEDMSFTTESKQNNVDALNKIQGDFLSAANETAKLIIDEITSHNKTIRPINIGGVAGGEKYIHNGILFKISLDLFKLFGGSDEHSMKLAGC